MRGFGREAEAYERSRPSYPPEAVAWLVRHLRLLPGTRVADLAAGTGKLTRLLLPTGASVVCIEPVEGCAWCSTRCCRGCRSLRGPQRPCQSSRRRWTRCASPKPSHWFDADDAFVELGRVLRPGGRVGLAWNARDRPVLGRQRVGDHGRVERRAPWRDHENWRESAFGERRHFGPLHSESFRHEHLTTPGGVVERILGVSHVAALPAREQREVLEKVRRLLNEHPETRSRRELRVPYRLDCYWTERQ